MKKINNFYQFCIKVNLLVVVLYVAILAIAVSLLIVYYNSFTARQGQDLLISIIVLMGLTFVVKVTLRIAFIIYTKKLGKQEIISTEGPVFLRGKKIALISGNYFCFSKFNDQQIIK